ncbi:hypothetical protein FACS189460_5750 [Deltaproteobacteria bacterium]|nr:hypothetical protein FACS189460_5750 [Deltaproteobacteria bacterium]
MIIDQFGVFFDNVAAVAAGTSGTVNVSPYAGRDNPINVTMIVTGANAAAVSLAVTLKESDDGTTFTDVAVYNLAKPDGAGAVLVFSLPYMVKKKFVRLTYALTGAVTGLKVFAAVTRDHFAPYDKGQYIDHGKVVA